MIKHIHIENFKCFKDFDLDLGPFNVLVGPNDSGKSTLLEAIRILEASCLRSPTNNTQLEAQGYPHFANSAFTHSDSTNPIRIRASEACGHSVASSQVDLHYHGRKSVDAPIQVKLTGHDNPQDATVTKEKLLQDWTRQCIGKVAAFRLEPSQLRQHSRKFRSDARGLNSPWLDALDISGKGFPTFLHDFITAKRHRFFEMENRFYKSFPAYESIHVIDVGPAEMTIWKLVFKSAFGQELEATEVSDGTMLYLAYLAIAYEADGPTMLLVEEPENGIHHRSLEDVVSVLRKLSEDEDKQVILTTHSPYLLDLVKPEEVKVFHKKADGSVEAKAMSDYEEVQVMKKHFMTGEIWTALGEEEIITERREEQGSEA